MVMRWSFDVSGTPVITARSSVPAMTCCASSLEKLLHTLDLHAWEKRKVNGQERCD